MATKKAATKAPAKKAPATKASAKKAVAKKTVAKKAASTPGQSKYPRHSVDRALRIPKAVYDQNGGRPVTAIEAARLVGSNSATGNTGLEIASARKYGFFGKDADGKITLTDRARRAIAPQSPTDRTSALQEAVLAAPDLADVYNYYRGESLPDTEFFRNALVDKFHIPPDKIDEFLSVFNDSIREAELLDESGDRQRLIDVGRDESHHASAVKKAAAATKELAKSGATCFVMQPFQGALGTYYESIFKPAIEQTGLQPVRADADIFGTGKIIDQIWRGINAADVLVAELTSKNPNVFYELGIAHALRKPVVLVSSNEDDVPFDLRHIRVILYDQTDPFWGQKLIDKIADNIASAISNPEEAIFPVEAP